ncbi:MAG: hypothetical protein IH628_00705, partial [Proteobacteria bacterium]|nr:hypothetical protein [Pseudomonadota bacterium]
MSSRVAVVYNHLGEDEYEKLKTIDPSSLEFKPEYSIHVSTVQEEYDSVVKALEREGFRARSFNVKDDLKALKKLLSRRPPDVIFNLV